jgi:hypothetical protein
MANPEHLEILKQGAEVWNEWRKTLKGLYRLDLTNASLSEIILSVYYPRLSPEDETTKIYSVGADLSTVNLMGADLSKAKLRDVNLSYANLNGVNFSEAIIWDADFTRASLVDANFNSAEISGAKFINIDLSKSRGLDKVVHNSASFISIDTLYKSAGKIPEAFLRGCGIPDDFIAFIPSHFGIQQAIQFYSCFISYSTRDEVFARRLYSRMRDEKLRVWFAPEDAQGGKKLYEQIERAIQVHDRLLIVLSERSLQSKWVMTEIRRARKVELKENRRKLFPIRLVDYETLQAWECFDADTGEDLAAEVRGYFIPDFSNWKDQDAFEKAFERLLLDLRAEETRPQRQ